MKTIARMLLIMLAVGMPTGCSSPGRLTATIGIEQPLPSGARAAAVATMTSD